MFRQLEGPENRTGLVLSGKFIKGVNRKQVKAKIREVIDKYAKSISSSDIKINL